MRFPGLDLRLAKTLRAASHAINTSDGGLWSYSSVAHQRPETELDSVVMEETGRRTCLSLLLEKERHIWLEAGGWSMFPVFRPGQRLRISLLQGTPKVGQVLVVVRGHKLVAHRLVEYDSEARKLILKGDTLHWFDIDVRPEEISGVVDRVLKDGREVDVAANDLVASFSLALGKLFSFRLRPGGPVKHFIYLAMFFLGLALLRFFGPREFPADEE